MKDLIRCSPLGYKCSQYSQGSLLEISIVPFETVFNLLINLSGDRVGSLSTLLALRYLPYALFNDFSGGDSNMLPIVSVRVVKIRRC